MEPVPGWARATAVLVAIATLLVVIPTLVLAVISLLAAIGQVQRTTAFDVGPAPRLRVQARFGTVAIEAGSDGRIVVQDQRSAGAITRADAAAALDQMAVDVSRQGDLVSVRQTSPLLTQPIIDRNSVITIRVPARTDVEVSEVGDLRVQGIDGAVHASGPGTVELRDTTLRGTSSIEVPAGVVEMSNVTVAGSAVVKTTLGGITFNGRLTPGGSSLDIVDGGGNVSVVLPRQTDARAVISARAGEFHADGTWLFTPDQVAAPSRWTADLAPNPTGSVTVSTTLGSVDFGSRQDPP